MLQFELASTFWAKTFPSGVGGLVIDVGLLDACGDACCWSFDYSFDRGIWANIAHAYFYKIKCALTQKCSSVDLAGVTPHATSQSMLIIIVVCVYVYVCLHLVCMCAHFRAESRWMPHDTFELCSCAPQWCGGTARWSQHSQISIRSERRVLSKKLA